MKSPIILVLSVLVFILAFSSFVYAGVPQMINYQGKITTPEGALIDTTIAMIFTIYDDSTTGNVLWADTQSAVVVEKGIFSVLLGSGNPIPDSVFPGDVRYLAVKVGADPEMTPRKSIVSVAYAYKSEHTDTAQYAHTAPAMADADWVISGDTIYHELGNVGIGTTSPAQKLDVAGTTQMIGFKMPTGAGTGKVLTSDGSGMGSWQTAAGGIGGSGTANYIPKFLGSTTLGNSIIYETGGNVGIGTTNPGYKLHVNGNFYSNSVNTGQGNHELYAMNQNVRTFDTPTFAAINTGLGNNELYAMNQNVRTIDSPTFASINTGPGNNELYAMNQNVRTSDSPTFASINTGPGNNELYAMDQNVRQSDSPTFNRVHLSDYGTALDGFHIGGTSDPGTDNLIVDGNVGIGTTPEDKLDVNGDVRVRGADIKDAGGTARITLTDNYRLDLKEDGGSVALSIATDGDVGIGTTSPYANAKLHVEHNNYYAGYFRSNRLHGLTHVIHSEFTGSGTYDARAVYGKSTPADYYGYGGYFEGGYKGVHAQVAPTGDDFYYGVHGYVSGGSGTNYAFRGYADGTGTNYGIYAYAGGGTTNYAGYFSGNARVTGTLSKGGGSFQIDHPLDPENKYLCHSFVESPDMMNVYNGNVTLDASGEAVVQLPDYFRALNRDFRYQLTCIGGFAPVYIAEEISGNQFTIAGGEAGVKVSWQVTGIRKDPFAEANRIQVEVDKPEDERGKYLHPEAYKLGEEYDIHYEQNKRMKEKEDQRKLD